MKHDASGRCIQLLAGLAPHPSAGVDWGKRMKRMSAPFSAPFSLKPDPFSFPPFLFSLFSFLLRTEGRSCPVCASGVCGCGCGVARGDGARGGGSAVVGSPKSERGCEWGVRVWLRGGEERGRAGRGISGRRLVEVRDRVGGKGSRRRGSVIQGVWGQSSPSCLTRAGLSRGAGQRDAATFTLPYVFVSPPSGCSILSSLSLPRRGGGLRAWGTV